mmetsp:Transcript_17931/g.29912  ORF Transcript_17931/g.29912 Transcript_17931/m.29912 type:complete len:277 (-) Transcript_17931:529-1359(-)
MPSALSWLAFFLRNFLSKASISSSSPSADFVTIAPPVAPASLFSSNRETYKGIVLWQLRQLKRMRRPLSMCSCSSSAPHPHSMSNDSLGTSDTVQAIVSMCPSTLLNEQPVVGRRDAESIVEHFSHHAFFSASRARSPLSCTSSPCPHLTHPSCTDTTDRRAIAVSGIASPANWSCVPRAAGWRSSGMRGSSSTPLPPPSSSSPHSSSSAPPLASSPPKAELPSQYCAAEVSVACAAAAARVFMSISCAWSRAASSRSLSRRTLALVSSSRMASRF